MKIKEDRPEIVIATAADGAFFYGLVCMLYSLLLSADEAYSYRIHVLDGGIGDEEFLQLNRFLALAAANVDYELIRHQINLAEFDGFDVEKNHSSSMTYARLLLPNLIESDSVLYVDSDILIGKDISALFYSEVIDFTNYSACAVKDVFVDFLHQDCPWDMSGDDKFLPYFNAGFMMINLKFWRENEIASKSLELLRADSSRCLCQDQTALNYLLRRKIKFLPPEWNLHAKMIRPHDFSTAGANYHFLGKDKPWAVFSPAFPFLYFNYLLSQTSFSPDFDASYFRNQVMTAGKGLNFLDVCVCVLKEKYYSFTGDSRKMKKRKDKLELNRRFKEQLRLFPELFLDEISKMDKLIQSKKTKES